MSTSDMKPQRFPDVLGYTIVLLILACIAYIGVQAMQDGVSEKTVLLCRTRSTTLQESCECVAAAFEKARVPGSSYYKYLKNECN